MSQTYTVQQADRVKTVQTKFGEMEVIRLMLDDNGQEVEAEMLQKVGGPLPDGQIEGTIDSNEYGLRFKRTRPGFDGRAGFKTQSPSPERETAIVRQHSEKCALMFCQIKAVLNKEEFAKQFSLSYVRQLTDWFAADATGKKPEPYL